MEDRIFLHTIYGYLRFYTGIENLILPMLSYPSCHVLRAVHWLYWNSRTWSSSDVVVMVVSRHQCEIAYKLFRDFWKLILKFCHHFIIKVYTPTVQLAEVPNKSSIFNDCCVYAIMVI